MDDGASAARQLVAFAPGRVNLIGDHTDYSGGLVLPIAIQLGTTVRVRPGGRTVRLTSADQAGTADVPLDVADPAKTDPPWARYVAGVVAELRPAAGGEGEIATTIPIGSGLSSSAALEVAVALALGYSGSPLELARACRRAEQRASGVPCGIMDQLASAAGQAGHALLIDCHSEEIEPVPVPDACEIVVVHSGQARTLAGSAYADRRDECLRAADIIGPLRLATIDDLGAIRDPVLRRRARHVVTENSRVRDFASALGHHDLVRVGHLMGESHRSLAEDFEVSTAALDELVGLMEGTPGVHGARLTGAGFGGCVVALTEPGAVDLNSWPPGQAWTVTPSPGASVHALDVPLAGT